MELNSKVKKILRPFLPIIIPIYKMGRRVFTSFLLWTNERIANWEDSKYCLEIQTLLSGFRSDPTLFAERLADHPNVPADIQLIAKCVSQQDFANLHMDSVTGLSKGERNRALRILNVWVDDAGKLESVLVVCALVNTELQSDGGSYSYRCIYKLLLRRAFAAAVRQHKVVETLALCKLMPRELSKSLRPILEARLPFQIGRTFVPDDGKDSLAWMANFPESEHNALCAKLLAACQPDNVDELKGISFDILHRVIVNPKSLNSRLDGPYYTFLEAVSRVDEREDSQSAFSPSYREALVTRKLMRREVLLRDYRTALTYARQLCLGEEVIPEDCYMRTYLLNRLGKARVVKRYTDWLLKQHERETAPAHEIAVRLWGASLPKTALKVLGTPDAYAKNEKTANIALRSLIRLRHFPEASELARRCSKWYRLKRLVETANEANEKLADAGIEVTLGEDATLHVIPHWLKQNNVAPLPTYIPEHRRVLLYSHSLGIGGAERQVTNLVSSLCADPEASSVHLLLKERPKESFELSVEPDRLTIHELKKLPIELPADVNEHKTFQEVFSLSPMLGIAGLEQMLRAIYQLRPEVVHVRGGMHAEALLASVLAGVPRVVVHFGSMTRRHQSSGTELEMQREHLVERCIGLCSEYDSVVLAANSRAAADDWASASGVPNERVIVLYNAINMEEFDSTTIKPFKATTSAVVGGVFRFATVKDPLLWIDIAAKVNRARPETKFLMVGDGPLRKSVERKIEKEGLVEQFEIPGMIKSGLFEFIKRMDISLMSTKTESLPNSVIEAQLAGLPVVAPDVGGISEAIADETTARLTERTTQALSEAVIEAIDDQTWRKYVHGRAPTLISQKFSRSAQLQSTKHAYGWTDSPSIDEVK